MRAEHLRNFKVLPHPQGQRQITWSSPSKLPLSGPGWTWAQGCPTIDQPAACASCGSAKKYKLSPSDSAPRNLESDSSYYSQVVGPELKGPVDLQQRKSLQNWGQTAALRDQRLREAGWDVQGCRETWPLWNERLGGAWAASSAPLPNAPACSDSWMFQLFPLPCQGWEENTMLCLLLELISVGFCYLEPSEFCSEQVKNLQERWWF